MLRAFGIARTRSAPLLVITIVLLALAAFTGCSDDDDKNPVGPGGNAPSTDSTNFIGFLASPNLSAKFGITVGSANLARGLHRAGAVLITATGTFDVVGGGTVTLTGSYNTELDTLYLAGGGYEVRGALSIFGNPTRMLGNWTGPGGESGGFMCIVAGDASVKVYCGRFASTMDARFGGWNMVAFADTAIVGLAEPDEGARLYFEGVLSRDETSPGIKSIGFGYWDDITGVNLFGAGTLEVATDAVAGDWATDDS